MEFGLKRDKPSELELRSAALEADEHFRGLTEIAQNQMRFALVNNYEQYRRTRKIALERYRSTMTLGVGVMLLVWGLGSAPRVDTFTAAVVLGMILGAVMERFEGATVMFALGCGISALLLGTLSGTFISTFMMPIVASYLGAFFGTTRWL
ncbi:MAG: hypothetical protein JKY61_09955 [Planctomycetes bacterium]|nr:hypothetical protein [Planctomycetota bacterium]